jgi:TonB family protein
MIKVSLIVLTGLAAARLLRKQSAAVRHWVLLATLACATALPAVERMMPVWNVPAASSLSARPLAQPVRLAHDATGSTTSGGLLRDTPERYSRFLTTDAVAALIGPLWIAGLSLNLLVLIVGFGRLSWLISRSARVREGRWLTLAEDISRQLGVRRKVAILRTSHQSLLVTCGFLRPKILLPRDAIEWPADRMRVVLGHELAHIRAGDWIAQLLAELLRCAYWFNPLLWLFCRRLRQESELACDDAVLGMGISGSEYASHLVQLARAARDHGRAELSMPAPAMVRTSSLERRVTAMLNKDLNRGPASRSTRLLAASVLVGVSVLVASVGAAAQAFATFSGSVFDPANGSISKATLTLTNVQSQAKYEVKSDQTGRFEFVGLPTGDYTLEVRFPGFATFNGTLSVSGQNIQRNLALQVGSLREHVTVVGGPSDGTSPRSIDRRAVPKRPVEECRAMSAGGELRPPHKVKHVNPMYPPHLWQAGIAGDVVLDVRIGLDGRVAAVDVVNSPHADLTAAAVEAVRQWDFDATLLNCAPIEVRMTATVSFRLK